MRRQVREKSAEFLELRKIVRLEEKLISSGIYRKVLQKDIDV